MDEQKTQEDEKNAQAGLDAHRLLVMLQFISALVIGVALLIMVKFINRDDMKILDAVMAAGALGGFVSSLRRLYAFQDVFPRKEIGKLFSRMNAYVVAYSLVPPLVGALAAIVLYLVFAAQIIEGGMFPKLVCAEGKQCIDLPDFIKYWHPADAVSNAKAVIWGFIAGFSEQFVPDLLNRLSTEAKK